MDIKRAISAFALLALSAGPVMAADAPPPRSIPRGTWDQEIMQAKITVSDIQKSFDFYTKTLGIGLKAVCPQMGPAAAGAGQAAGSCASIMLAGAATRDFSEVPLNFTTSMAETYFTLMQRKGQKPTPETAALTTIMLKVKDARGLLQRLQAMDYPGARGVEARARTPDTVYVFIKDPDGYILEIVQSPKLTRSPGE